MYYRQHFTGPGIVLAMVIGAYIPATQAADEDIDIPYTDTYGYVYDPETGAYIKQDQQATTGSTATTAAPADTVTQSAAVPVTMNEPAATTLPPPIRPGASASTLTVGILALLLVGVVVGLVMSSRRQKNRSSHSTDRLTETH